MRRLLPIVLVAGVLLAPSPGHAYINLSSGGGFLFDFHDVTDYDSPGTLSNGTYDAYDGCYRLTVGGTLYDPVSGAATMSLSGRQIEWPAMSIAGLSVRRLAYVPASGGDWARYLEVLENTGSSAVSTTVSITGNLGSDSGTVLHASSSGDAFASTADLWFATDDTSDGSGDPSLAHVFSGSSSSITPSAVSLSTDNITYTWNVTVPAGGRVVLMHFAVQTSNRAASVAEAMRLVEAPDDAVLGIDDYLDDIANFGVATPGAPRVRFTGPFSADEGSEVVLEVAVEDLEGDSYSFSWDLDDDGTFGEAPDATSYTIAAGTTDGPGAVRVGVRAVDAGGHASERYRTIQIVNVAPAVTSDPPLSTSVGVDFRYPLVVDDPAGELDALTFAIVRGPSRMTVSPEGIVQWTVTESDVTLPGETIAVEVSVDDGDEGTTSQSWEMTVSPNRRPTPPVPAYPIDMVAILDPTPRLAAGNSQDLDLDELTYHFQIDTTPTFDSADLRESGPLAETPGFTAWEITDPLPVQRAYYWRVWSNDGSIDSEIREGAFYVVRDPSQPLPDAGRPDGGAPGEDGGGIIPGLDAGIAPTSSGCSCRAAGSSGSRGVMALAIVALALGARRRRRARGL